MDVEVKLPENPDPNLEHTPRPASFHTTLSCKPELIFSHSSHFVSNLVFYSV